MTSTSTSTSPPVPPRTAPARPAGGGTRLAGRLLRGRADDAAWVRPGLLALLAATAVLYLWGLGASGWANSFYSAAAQAGSESWKAFFYGSLDAANSITVDKTPAALWVMGLSVRLFGLSSWSILVPEALMGVGTVALLYATVRRSFGPAAGLLAGAALAFTPVAALMFRFNNPDALLVLLLTSAAYATLRAIERTRGGASAGTWWLVLAGTCVGFGFLAKMLQAFLVVPVFALVYLIAADTPVRRRILALLAAGAAMVVSGGWWVAIVQLVPASARPYIGGSQNNSVLELALGYNGLGRLTGDETGGLGNTNQGVGPLRLFGSELGGQVAWLLPAALILLVALLWTAWSRSGGWRAYRTDPRVAAALLWGGWLVLTGAVFSLMNGIFHAYYTVALAPAIAALFGMGVARLWSPRDRRSAVLTLAGTFAVTSVWAYVLLARSSDWQPWLRWVVLVGGLLASGAVAATVVPAVRALGRRFALVAVGAAIVMALAGPAAYAVQTAGTSHTGAIPSAGPSGQGGFGMGPGGGGRPNGGGPFGQHRNAGPGNRPGMNQQGNARSNVTQGRQGTPPGMNGRHGGMGGLLGNSTPSAAVTKLLKADAGSYTWVAATVGANNAAGYQLATGSPVMALGGFNGTDPSPTLAQFKKYVAEGKIHYYIAGSSMMSARGSSTGSQDAQQIAKWVQKNYTPTKTGNTTLYDLTK